MHDLLDFALRANESEMETAKAERGNHLAGAAERAPRNLGSGWLVCALAPSRALLDG
ncbi:MAG: hypothetical protein LC659_06865 [Myxococcales bacterium]|nr:hypothetical protein [Myxococcales bacterium]